MILWYKKHLGDSNIPFPHRKTILSSDLPTSPHQILNHHQSSASHPERIRTQNNQRQPSGPCSPQLASKIILYQNWLEFIKHWLFQKHQKYRSYSHFGPEISFESSHRSAIQLYEPTFLEKCRFLKGGFSGVKEKNRSEVFKTPTSDPLKTNLDQKAIRLSPSFWKMMSESCFYSTHHLDYRNIFLTKFNRNPKEQGL